MNENEMIQISKRLARHLRHAPGEIGLTLSSDGWVPVQDLLAALARHGQAVTLAELHEVVQRNDKQRFAFDDEGLRIRASQGHSITVELDLPVLEPPAVLYHGTVGAVLEAIRREGLKPMRRHDVHLSADVATATRVGSRRGTPVILEVDAAGMHAAGYQFMRSANGVWLTATVPPTYLRFPA
ncbi:RNA 2'-phosphotransferase [Pseudonocardiaceae bacterium YIM PH 21723]|nr:RNA 2'-phosphotransferase [Pseudonocardiaceae bacterium YIM PH 21723]